MLRCRHPGTRARRRDEPMPHLSRRQPSPRGRAVVVAAWLSGAVLLGASPATAHTGLADSDPAAGARLQRAPERIVLRFTDAISADFAQLSVRRGTDSPRPLREVVDGATVSATLPAPDDSRQGRAEWVVAYRVVSADGHPITGSVSFTAPVGAPTRTHSEPSAATASPAETPRASNESSAIDSDAGADGTSVPWALLALGAVVGAVLLAAAARFLSARRSP